MKTRPLTKLIRRRVEANRLPLNEICNQSGCTSGQVRRALMGKPIGFQASQRLRMWADHGPITATRVVGLADFMMRL